MKALDAFRALFPGYGIAVYALDAGAGVTVEIMSPDGTIIAATRATAEEAFRALDTLCVFG